MTKRQLKRIAIFVPGGIADERKIIPAISNLVERISHEFDITVYDFAKLEGMLVSRKNLKVKSIRFPFKRHYFLTAIFLKDHFFKRYHLVHGFWGIPAGFIAVLLGKILRVPSIVSLQGGEAAMLPQMNYGNMRNWRLKKLTFWTCRHADQLTALTRFQWNAIRQFGLKRKNVHVIPYGADAKLFYPEKKSLSPPFCFLHVANLNAIKDQQTLLKAFAIIRQQVKARLKIVGSDFLNGQLHKSAKNLRLGDDIEFVGYVSHQELPRYYHWAHVMLHTSHYEAQGVVIAEAAASGVVVCGTHVGLIADLGKSCTVSVNVGDYKALAQDVLSVLNDPSKFKTLRRNAMDWAQVHDAEWTAKQFLGLYQNALGITKL